MSMQQSQRGGIEIVQPHYPAMMFVVRYGHALAIASALVVFAIGVWLIREGLVAGPGILIGAFAALLVYLLMRVLWEVVQLLADTLIPK